MSRPNLVLELSALKGLNQIRRNIGRLSSSYLDLAEIFQTTIELENQEVYGLVDINQLIVKVSAPVSAQVTVGAQSFTVTINQMMVWDFPIDQIDITNENAEPVQVIIVSSR